MIDPSPWPGDCSSPDDSPGNPTAVGMPRPHSRIERRSSAVDRTDVDASRPEPQGRASGQPSSAYHAGGAADATANLAELRRLCVHAELVSGQETPGDELALRREVQLQRLVSSMGQGARPPREELADLALRWLAVGHAPAGDGEALSSRFLGCLQVLAT